MGASLQTSGRSRSGRRRRNRPMAEINVTPMVDVMLVLLIIFMVAAPLLTVGVPIELPKTAATALPSDQEEPLTIALTRDGGILVQNSPVEPAQLIPLLRSVAAERKSGKVFLRADGGIPYEGVMQVMGALNASGFNDIGLVTEQGGPKFDGSVSGG
ncbi:biopolymer transport protein TolR [Amaricoccus macauensis]|uniref:Biopolymer transport protein TolR n=1 Tax=Amaricoccus macauensis TaxID=57001 RepID=A0A840SIY8_9RHOB|nr:biopolymer transport protein TolR [Amaricoccus macauensis]